MQESQWVGLLAIAAGAFSITGAVCNWEFFMNSRKARAWVKIIGRNNARLMYGGIGVFVCLFGLGMVIIAPGDRSTPQAGTQTHTPDPQSTSRPPQRPAASGQPSRRVGNPDSPTSYVVSDPAPSTVQTQPTPTPSTTPATSRPPANTTPQSTAPAVASTTAAEKVTSSAEPMPVTPSPAAADPEPLTSATVPEGGIDLLPLIDPQEHRLRGSWTRQADGLLSSKDRPAGLYIPFEVPSNYQLIAVVEPIEGNELASLGLIVKGHGVSALAGGAGGTNCGLQFIDGRIARQNETRHAAVLTAGKNRIVCTVQGNHIHFECNGETVVDWTGDPERLSFGPNPGPEDQLRISTWNTRCLFSELVLVPLQ